MQQPSEDDDGLIRTQMMGRILRHQVMDTVVGIDRATPETDDCMVVIYKHHRRGRSDSVSDIMGRLFSV